MSRCVETALSDTMKEKSIIGFTKISLTSTEFEGPHASYGGLGRGQRLSCNGVVGPPYPPTVEGALGPQIQEDIATAIGC